MRSFVTVLWKKNEEVENYEFAAILNDISQNFDAVNEIKTIKNDSEGYGKIWREFQTDKKPKYWVVWPYSTTNGWCERITGDL